MRLQKYLARCGVDSRRRCEELIRAGAVTVDGVPVTEAGTKVDPERQRVAVHGERVAPLPPVFFALHKPRGVVCTHSDPAGRPRAIDLVPASGRLFPIGRLDAESEGLLLLTNDGDLAQRVSHPRYEVPKFYRVVVKGAADPQALERIRRGVWLAEGKTAPARVDVIRRTREATVLSIEIREGRNRHLRRVLARVGLPVQRLVRVRVGPVRIGSLKRGAWRRLTRPEIEALREGRLTLPRERTGPRPRKGGRRRASPGARAKGKGRGRGAA